MVVAPMGQWAYQAELQTRTIFRLSYISQSAPQNHVRREVHLAVIPPISKREIT